MSNLISRKIQFLICMLFTFPAFSQETTIVETDTDRWHKVVIAGKKYNKSAFHNWLWGSHYRKEWATPVKVKIIHLDSIYGGLTPVEKGGGRQTKNLRLEDRKGKQYVLRSIDKTYTGALPGIFQGTFVETIANDQVSVAHPYAAFTVFKMAEAAKIYHTNPSLVFLPGDKKLGEFNEEFSNQLYLLEERPDGDQRKASNFGNSEDVVETEKMMEKITDENVHRVDQAAWVRARLFDMFVGDWGRHEDQWRWATFKNNDLTIYKPIPRDRDQTFTKYDGLIVSKLAASSTVGYLSSFDHTIKDVNKYNYQARHLDRRLANEPSRQTWIDIANDLQQLLTDAIIENSVKQLPPEVYPISGPGIIAKLKSRRDHLLEYANEYYTVLAEEVDIVGSKQNDHFEITNVGTGEVTIQMFKQDNKGNRSGQPFYSRTFLKDETKEIRIFGLDGHDNFNIAYPGKAIKIRIIGGPSKDVFTYTASTENKHIAIYDNVNNQFKTGNKVKINISPDSSVHLYNYNAYKFDKKGFKPGISFSREDRLYVSLGYIIQKQEWRKAPFGNQHEFLVNYSLMQKAFSFQYKALYNQLIGKWNVGFDANYDLVRDMFYLGTGNNSIKSFEDREFYRMRSREVNSGLHFIRPLDSNNTVTVSGLYRSIKILKDSGKFISVNQLTLDPSVYNPQSFAGMQVEYRYEKFNDNNLPTKGFHFSSAGSFTTGLKTSNSFARFTGLAGIYFPVLPNVIAVVRAGAATVTGHPPFYELNRLGGGSSVRGYLRFRFYGKTTFFNQNELQWHIKVKSWLMNGKIGFLGFVDNGRVWQPGEESNIWHNGYGFGVIIAPFNKFSITASYGMSPETNLVHLRVGRSL